VLVGMLLLPAYLAFWVWELMMRSTLVAFEEFMDAVAEMDQDEELSS
jgi:hypothetical protein